MRPRYEARYPLAGEAEAFTSMRTRAHPDAEAERSIRAFVQLHDVRLFGEESGTLSDFRADDVDLHQGFLQAGDGGDARLDRDVVFGCLMLTADF